MKRPVRLALIAAGALALVAALAALALPLLIDVDRYRPTVEAKAEEALGRDVRLGAMRLSLLPLGVRVDDLAIAALPGEGGGDLLAARSVRVGARLLPLLSRRLEVTSIVVDRPVATLERRPDGTWNLQHLVARDAAPPSAGPSPDSPAPALSVERLSVSDGQVTLRVAAAGGGKADLVLTGVQAGLTGAALDREIGFEFEAALSIAPGARLQATGRIGPLQPRGTAALRADLTLSLEGIPAASLGKWAAALGAPALPADLLGETPLGVEAHVTADSNPGTTALRAVTVDRLRVRDLDLGLRRSPGGRWNYEPLLGGGPAGARAAPGPAVALSGIVIENARIRIRDEAGGGKPFEPSIERLDLTLDRLPTAGPAKGDLALRLAGTDVKVQGTVDASGRRLRLDLSLLPTRIRAEGLQALLALAGSDVPLSFSAGEPIEIAARVQGEMGDGKIPDLSGRLTLKEFSFRHPSMREPMTDVNGTIALAGQQIEIRGFSARMGGSDLAGDLTVQGLRAPRIRFDLRSRKADFWELMSFVGGAEPGGGGGGSTPSGSGEFLRGVVAEGTLRIDSGSFRTLDFTALDAGLRLAGREITLEPFRMDLYAGKFQGKATLDLSRDPAAFDVRADVDGLDIDPLLTDNLGLAGFLSGRFRGGLEARGAGAGFEAIARSLAGGGTIQVVDGSVGKLDVLGILSQATGVFGEQTLHAVSRKLETEGTPFSRLSATLQLGGGRLRSDDLRLDSPDLAIAGAGALDLVQGTIDLKTRVIFSREMSDSMRAEGSRAAQAFWDPKLAQVSLPLSLSGPFASPAPGIDWGTAGRNLAQRKAEEKLAEKLGLGSLFGGAEAPPPAAAAPGAPPTDPAVLAAEIGRARWGGSLLGKDLKLEGVVRGARLDRVAVVVTDAGGREVERVERLQELVNYLAAAADRAAPASVRWDHTVSGKKLAGATLPLTVRVIVTDTAGKTAEARVEVAN